MRHLREPLTLGKHDKLAMELNDFVIAAKVHHTHPPEREEKKENWEKVMNNYKCPTWDNVIELMQKAIQEMQQCSYDPRKY